MVRTVVGIVLGVVGWFVVALGVAFVLGKVAPGLSAEMKVHATMIAQAERLGISFLGSLIGGALAGRFGSARSPFIAGLLLLAFWGYYHVMVIWHQFPVWYHLTFLISLVLLSVLGGRMAAPARKVFG